MGSRNPFLGDSYLGGVTETPPSGDRGLESILDTLTALIGTDPIAWFADLEKVNDELYTVRQQLAVTRAQRSRLESEYGSVGSLPSIWDHKRKAYLDSLIAKRRAETDAKASQTSLDSWAHASEEYGKFLDDAQRGREEYEKLSADMDKIWAKVHHLTAKREYLEQRIRLNEELIRAARNLANLER